MAVEILTAVQDHVDELGRILYEAYKDLTDRHNFPHQYANAASAQSLVGSTVDLEFAYPIAAFDDGVPVGYSCMWLGGDVSGIGPVGVDPPAQGLGAAKAMISHFIDYAEHHGIEMIRLTQRAYNPLSLSLYASLGFDVRESFMELTALPGRDPEGAVREFNESDYPAIKELSTRLYKVDRSVELSELFQLGCRAIVRERNGNITGYIVSGMGGHGMAETDDDALALMGESVLRFPEQNKFNCPLSLGDFYRKALKVGCRAVEVHTLMTYGPYEPPDGIWMPSSIY